jgi:hypothetical protein
VGGHGLDFSGATYRQMGTCEQDIEPANAFKIVWWDFCDYIEVSKE